MADAEEADKVIIIAPISESDTLLLVYPTSCDSAYGLPGRPAVAAAPGGAGGGVQRVDPPAVRNKRQCCAGETDKRQCCRGRVFYFIFTLCLSQQNFRRNI